MITTIKRFLEGYGRLRRSIERMASDEFYRGMIEDLEREGRGKREMQEITSRIDAIREDMQRQVDCLAEIKSLVQLFCMSLVYIPPYNCQGKISNIDGVSCAVRNSIRGLRSIIQA